MISIVIQYGFLIFATLVAIEFGIRVIRFAITGKGGVNERFDWWNEGKHEKKKQKRNCSRGQDRAA